MTNILYKNLQKKYTQVLKVIHPEISIYGASERIYFTFMHIKYTKSDNKLISIPEIKNISKEVFNDISHKFYETLGVMENVIKFYPELTNKELNIKDKNFKYINNYSEHDIEFGSLEDRYLHITLATGNRGRSKLVPKQREKYKLFLDKIVERTLINTNT